jgi:hypothetical protein
LGDAKSSLGDAQMDDVDTSAANAV